MRYITLILLAVATLTGCDCPRRDDVKPDGYTKLRSDVKEHLDDLASGVKSIDDKLNKVPADVDGAKSDANSLRYGLPIPTIESSKKWVSTKPEVKQVQLQDNYTKIVDKATKIAVGPSPREIADANAKADAKATQRKVLGLAAGASFVLGLIILGLGLYYDPNKMRILVTSGGLFAAGTGMLVTLDWLNSRSAVATQVCLAIAICTLIVYGTYRIVVGRQTKIKAKNEKSTTAQGKR